MSKTFQDYIHQTYKYIIDLNERGSFRAHVENANGKEVYCIKAGDELAEGDTSILEDGFMRHIYDLKGLAGYLRLLGIMPENSTLIKG